MKKIFLIQLLILLTLLSCNKKSEDSFCDGFFLKTPTLIDSCDYEIINSILEQYSNSRFLHINQEININSVSIGEGGIKSMLEYENIEIDTSILINYFNQNDSNYYIADSCMLNFVHSITSEEIDCIFENVGKGWEKYYQKYSNSTGIFYFSRPGYNNQKEKAIIEYNWSWNYLGAEWYIVILERVDDKWIVRHHILTAIS